MSRASLRQYAQAYLATAADAHAAVAAFDACVDMLARVPSLRGFLNNTAVAAETRRRALATAVPTAPTEALNLCLLLAKERRLRDAGALAQVLREEAAAANDKTHAVVTSAVPLAAPLLKRLASLLTARFGADVWLESRVDPSVIAGLHVQSGDWVFDATQRGRLLRLERALLTSHS